MKGKIRQFALGLGVDDVGFVAAADYRSPRSPALEKLHPGARSIIVLAYKELDTCDSGSPNIQMNGRMDLMEFSRSVNYKMARYLDREFGASAVTVGVSYPIEMSAETKGAVGELSLRHAAQSAGLGTFGRHNLIIHPEMGTRVIFSALVTDLELESDVACEEELCTQCGLCVESCPGRALDKEGFTNLVGCIKNSQPYGIGGSIKHWSRFAVADEQERLDMLRDPHYWKLYQAAFIGFQYVCWNCLRVCPIGRDGTKGKRTASR